MSDVQFRAISRRSALSLPVRLRAVMAQMVMMHSAQPVALDAKHLQSVDPFDPARHAIVYNARLSPSAKFLQCLPTGCISLGQAASCGMPTCSPCCNILQWEKLNVRSFVRVYGQTTRHADHAG
jgi:hypothetical protein